MEKKGQGKKSLFKHGRIWALLKRCSIWVIRPKIMKSKIASEVLDSWIDDPKICPMYLAKDFSKIIDVSLGREIIVCKKGENEDFGVRQQAKLQDMERGKSTSGEAIEPPAGHYLIWFLG